MIPARNAMKRGATTVTATKAIRTNQPLAGRVGGGRIGWPQVGQATSAALTAAEHEEHVEFLAIVASSLAEMPRSGRGDPGSRGSPLVAQERGPVARRPGARADRHDGD